MIELYKFTIADWLEVSLCVYQSLPNWFHSFEAEAKTLRPRSECPEVKTKTKVLASSQCWHLWCIFRKLWSFRYEVCKPFCLEIYILRLEFVKVHILAVDITTAVILYFESVLHLSFIHSSLCLWLTVSGMYLNFCHRSQMFTYFYVYFSVFITTVKYLSLGKLFKRVLNDYDHTTVL